MGEKNHKWAINISTELNLNTTKVSYLKKRKNHYTNAIHIVSNIYQKTKTMVIIKRMLPKLFGQTNDSG